MNFVPISCRATGRAKISDYQTARIYGAGPHDAQTLRTSSWVTLALLISLLVGAGVPGCKESQSTAVPTTLPVAIAGQRFELELALTPQNRFRGLSDRKEIALDGGMLFAFPMPEVQVFVMRRCLVPIDIIFLDPTGRIVATHAMEVEPYDQPEHQLARYTSTWPAQFVIELKGGTLGTLGLKLGQKIELPVDELKHWAH